MIVLGMERSASGGALWQGLSEEVTVEQRPEWSDRISHKNPGGVVVEGAEDIRHRSCNKLALKQMNKREGCGRIIRDHQT